MTERLEIIKMDNERYHQEVVFSSQVLNDIKWLINRVEELETQLSINTNNMKHLQNKIERYKQALENITISSIPLEIDEAVNIALQALEGDEDEENRIIPR